MFYCWFLGKDLWCVILFQKGTMSVHRSLERFAEPPITDLSNFNSTVCSFDRPYLKVLLVIGDEFATEFYGMYRNILANGFLPRGEAERNMHVQFATFPEESIPSIHTILNILGSYEFDTDVDIVLIALLHCDLLQFNHEKGYCWAYSSLRQNNITDICARYATLHKWILDKIDGHDRPVTIQLLKPPAFHFLRYNERYFKYLDNALATGKPLKPGEKHLSSAQRINLVNEVYKSYITNLTCFENQWSDYYGELVMLDVNECILKAYQMEGTNMPQEENLHREYYTIAEGHSPTDHPRSKYSPFSKDGIIPSHDGVVRILRQANKNYNYRLARDKYPNLASTNFNIYPDAITAHYPSESWDLVFSLSKDWTNMIEERKLEYKNENDQQDFPVIILSSRTPIPEKPLIRERLDEVRLLRHEIELNKRLTEALHQINVHTQNLRAPNQQESTQAIQCALQVAPTKTMKRNATKRRQKQRKRQQAEAEAEAAQSAASGKKQCVEQANAPATTTVSTMQITIDSPRSETQEPRLSTSREVPFFPVHPTSSSVFPSNVISVPTRKTTPPLPCNVGLSKAQRKRRIKKLAKQKAIAELAAFRAIFSDDSFRSWW